MGRNGRGDTGDASRFSDREDGQFAGGIHPAATTAHTPGKGHNPAPEIACRASLERILKGASYGQERI